MPIDDLATAHESDIQIEDIGAEAPSFESGDTMYVPKCRPWIKCFEDPVDGAFAKRSPLTIDAENESAM